ncbi:MAG TPA: carbamate kinase [Acidobacteriota bacterium]|nr:carbamate kinase [Acidobacteriota bacterium]
MLVVIALGGNALLRREQKAEASLQRENVRLAAQAVAAVARRHKVVVTHGNGPQVGLLALQSLAYREVDPYPLDVLGAESEGMIGYMIEQELGNDLPGRQVATLLTQTVVDADDPAFHAPTKFVGPQYEEEEARRLQRNRGWTLEKDGDKYRRVVPSPAPQRILELPTIRLLVEHNVLVVCAGGGGIPVAINGHGAVRGVEAVVDKDRASALLASDLGADALLMLTDVEAVYRNWGQPGQQPLRRTTPDDIDPSQFAAGSMGPKVEAACRFVRGGSRQDANRRSIASARGVSRPTASGGPLAGIGALANAAAILRGESGTVIRSSW